MQYSKIYDISVFLQEDPDNYVQKIVTPICIGDSIFNGLRLDLNVHYGTHVDAPCHLTPNTKTIDQYPIERFLLPAMVLDIQDTDSVKIAELKKYDIKPNTAVLLKTENSRSGKSKVLPFPGEHVCVEPDALQYLIDKGVTMVGFDAPHGERDAADITKQKNPIHSTMFDNDCIILESVDLAQVPEGDYTLIVLPLKVRGVNGSPARAILMKE